jgi:hypothetical protein
MERFILAIPRQLSIIFYRPLSRDSINCGKGVLRVGFMRSQHPHLEMNCRSGGPCGFHAVAPFLR